MHITEIIFLSRYTTFEEFVMSYLGGGETLKLNHTIPQWQFLCDTNGELIVDTIIKLEELNEGFEKLGDLSGLYFQFTIENKSNRSKDYKSYYTEDMKKVIGDVYARDIEEFGYEF